MQVILFTLIGLVLGALLDPLVARLAASAPEEEPAPPEDHTVSASFGEAGQARVATLVGEGPLWRRLLIMAVTGVAFGVTAARYEDTERAAVISAYAAAFIVCAATDLMAFRVPNVVTYPAAAAALVAAALMPNGDVAEALIGGAVGGGLMLGVALLSRGGLGLGDVKLAGFAGLALGGPLILPALLITALAGGVAAAGVAVRVRRRSHPMPYAPFISAGAIAVLLWQGSAFASL
jgi:leader peptidase (prepilin peptidase)/N-methyltransferase